MMTHKKTFFNQLAIRHNLFFLLFFALNGISHAQETFEQLKANYSGNVTWDAGTSTVTFTSNGTINFTNKASNFKDPFGGQTLQVANWMWNVPTAIKKIVVKKNVTVTGGFHTKGDITISGEDQNTSVIYGTPLQSWADKNNPKKVDLDEWHYCQIQVYGGVCNIKNLKILDPFSFAVRGWGPQIHMKKVSIIDTRGGWGNHSDGFEGGDNSTIDSCFFETGDDNIKVYFKNLKVTNTEIKMVQNSVPIQFGWGNYNDNASATFENCRITGTSGRGSDKAIIDNAGSTQRNKTVEMNNCYIENTEGTIFRTAVGVSAPYAINVTIKNSYVKVKKYESSGYNANGTRTICGSTNKLALYDCRTTAVNQAPTVSLTSPSSTASFIAPASVTISANVADTDGSIAKVEFYNGTTLLNSDNSSPYSFNWTSVAAGAYSITAKAFDNTGATKTSAVVSITVSAVSTTGKPNVWIQTDLTSVIKYPTITSSTTVSEAETDQNSDADDQVALAQYLMLANKFNTVGIVLGVTNRDTDLDTKAFFDKTFRTAYAADYACLSKNFSGYPTPESLNVMESSMTAGSGFRTFKNSPDNQYDDYTKLPATTKSLVDELKSNKYSATNPLYVLVWGGLDEAAMAIKHLQKTGNTAALNRLFVVSHWTSSFFAQGTPQTPFEVANCRSGREACDYVHNEAKKINAAFKFVDLGSVGQGGIVSGYGKWFAGWLNGDRAKQFRKSKLGDLMIKSKFTKYGYPDGSDCATFYALLGTYGVKLSDYNSNGVLTEEDERAGVKAFGAKAQGMLDELLAISDKAFGCTPTDNGGNDGGGSTDPVPVDTFLKAYPNPTTGLLTLPEVFANDQIKVVSQFGGKTVLTKTIMQDGATELDITNQVAGNYIIQITRNNQLISRLIIKL